MDIMVLNELSSFEQVNYSNDEDNVDVSYKGQGQQEFAQFSFGSLFASSMRSLVRGNLTWKRASTDVIAPLTT